MGRWRVTAPSSQFSDPRGKTQSLFQHPYIDPGKHPDWSSPSHMSNGLSLWLDFGNLGLARLGPGACGLSVVLLLPQEGEGETLHRQMYTLS